MKRLLCRLGFHKLVMTTKSTSIDGTVKKYYKCRLCNKKIKKG